jgi:predicted O-methyltransferase YrrM
VPDNNLQLTEVMELNNDIESYILKHTDQEDEDLYALSRETNLRAVHPRMLSGHLQGSVLRMLSKMIKPEQILEIGTFTGYSAICLAQGMANNGHLHTIEINDEITDLAVKYIEKKHLESKITIHIGNALEIIPQIAGLFDLVYIDGEKSEYTEYYKLVIEKVRNGGYIIIDNILWSGKVLGTESPNDHFTKGIKEFNNYVLTDDRIEKVILPFRDGLMIIRKK